MAGVPGKSGRKPKSMQTATVHGIITDSAPLAILYISHVVRGKVKRPSPVRLQECHYIVDQCIGKATQRIEHKAPPSAPLSWGELMKSAQEKTTKEEGKETAELVAAAGEIVAGKTPQVAPETVEVQPPELPEKPDDQTTL